MKTLLVVDDEGPVVDHIVRLVERHLSDRYRVVGRASSGRETLDLVPRLAPDILVLDVRMPGLSGLETVRELHRRGPGPAVVLSTAYERFDIVRDALELGISGYILKPVGAEALARALGTAADLVDRRAEGARQAVDRVEETERLRAWAAEAFLGGIAAGRIRTDGAPLRAWLGVDKPWALVGAAAFPHHAAEAQAALEAAVGYKAGGLVRDAGGGRLVVYLPLSAAEGAAAARGPVEAALGPGRLGWADPRPADELEGAWAQAVGRLGGRSGVGPGADPDETGGPGPLARPFDADEAFFEALVPGDPEGLRRALDGLLEPFEAGADPTPADRYRVMAALATALVRLTRRGGLDQATAAALLDLDDLRTAEGPGAFVLAARTRGPALTAALTRARRWSPPLAGALDLIRDHFGEGLTLESVSDRLGLPPKRLSKLFIDEVGQGFSDYLIDFRIAEAKVRLALPGASVKQVAAECGYPDPNYFARLFKKVTGLTPTEYAADAGFRLTARPGGDIIAG